MEIFVQKCRLPGLMVVLVSEVLIQTEFGRNTEAKRVGLNLTEGNPAFNNHGWYRWGHAAIGSTGFAGNGRVLKG